MIKSKLYKLYPLINNSFEKTLNVFVFYISQKYDIKETEYHNSCSPDKTTVGYNLSNMKPPEYITVTVNFMSNNSWTNKGGVQFCTLKINSKNKEEISIRWNTYFKVSELSYTSLDNNFFRKIKLEKLKEI